MVQKGLGSNMSADTIKSYVERLFAAIPDGTTLPYEQVLEHAGKDQAWLKALVFGKPTTIGRNQDTFTARAEAPADMPPMLPGFIAHSDKEVHFTLKVAGDRAEVTGITGITITAPIGPRFTMDNASIRIDSQGQILVSTRKIMFTITVVMDQEGKYVTWRPW